MSGILFPYVPYSALYFSRIKGLIKEKTLGISQGIN